MKKTNNIFFILLLFFMAATGCQSVKDGLTGKKKQNSEEHMELVLDFLHCTRIFKCGLQVSLRGK